MNKVDKEAIKNSLDYIRGTIANQIALTLVEGGNKVYFWPKELAKSSGVSQRKFRKIMFEQITPSLEDLVKIARACGCELILRFRREE